MSRTNMEVRSQPGGIYIAEDVGNSTGSRFYVSSGTGTDGAGYGQSPDSPVATLDYAIGLCTANAHDIVYVMPGHAENVTTATSVVADIAGIRIVGLGKGSNRPTFTVKTNATASFVITAANVTVDNLLLVCGTDGINGGVTVTGADCTFSNCEFRDATGVEADIWIAASGVRLKVLDCFFNGDTAPGDQQESAISLTAVAGALVERCRFFGEYLTGTVNMATNSVGVVVKDSVFYCQSKTDLSKSVVDTGGSSKWEVANCYDIGAGCGFSGGSGAALAKDDASAIAASIGTLTNTGGTATLGGILGDVANVTVASSLSSIKTMTDKVGTVTNTGGTASIGAVLGDVANTSIATRLTNILAAVGDSAAFAWGVADAGVNSTTEIACAGLAGYGDDFFNNQYYMQILHNANSAGNAPEKTTRQITDYVSATGTFTCTAFGAAVEASDIILILHESAVMIGRDDNDNVASTSNVASNADGSVLEREEYIQAQIGTLANTGGTATLGGIIGDVSNVSVATNLAKIGTITNTGGTATLGGVLGDVANVSVATNLAKIGTIANTGGTATIGGVLGDVANVTVAASLAKIGTLANTGGTATLGGILGDVANVSVATNLAKVGTITNTGGTATLGGVLGDVANKSVASRMNSMQVCIEKSDGVVSNGTDALFTVTGGPIIVEEFVGIVTTVIGGAANCHIDATTTEPAATTPLSTDVAIDSDDAGTSYTFTVADPGVLTPTTNGAVDNLARAHWLVPIGSIGAHCSADQTGNIKWYMVYRPLSPNSVVTAAA